MFGIYIGSSRVLIWLGEADTDSDLVLSNSSSLARPSRSQEQRFHKKAGTEEDWARLNRESAVWASFFSRKWWQRMWTLQEGLAASIQPQSLVLCGVKRMDWLDLLQRRHNWLSRPEFEEHSIRPIDDFLEICACHEDAHRLGLGAAQQPLNLVDMFWASFNRVAGNPCDYVFALLGPLDSTDVHRFEPDYTMPLLWVFQQAMVGILATAERLMLLLVKVKQGPCTAPSWCLDFRERKDLVEWHTKLCDPCRELGELLMDYRDVSNTATVVRNDLRCGTITLVGLSFGMITSTAMLTVGDEFVGLEEVLLAHGAHTPSVHSVHYSYVTFSSTFGTSPVYVFFIGTNVVGFASQEVVEGDTLALLHGAILPLVLRRQDDMSFRIIDVVFADYIEDDLRLNTGSPLPKTEFVLS
jgi:hypothetical protein